jgi:two-component system, OmpR family, heavy metal sensor histidine kinase CusS
MFWTNVKIRIRTLSLVTKLMLFYTLSTIGILTAFCFFLRPIFIRLMENQGATLTTGCIEKLILAHFMGFFAAIAFGYLIAKKGLSKLRDFENKMEQINVNSLHEKINSNEWPKELTNLAKKFNTMLDRIHTPFTQHSQFSSDIAHELRTPINNLMGITEIALSKENMNKEQQIIFEKYMNEYQHLSKLIENLLFFARSDNGQIKLNMEKIDARKEILNICDYYQAIAEENKITVSCEGEAFVLADLVLFKRAVSNLLSNAIRYTLPSGKITVKIKPLTLYVEISVHDSGIGISNEHLRKIFDRFYRADSSRSTHTGGLGLGLSIVKSIIDLHKGNITINSQPNVGTSVYLHLKP